MQFSSLIRDKKAVLKNLYKMDDGSLITSVDCSIIIPSKWIGTPLAHLEGEVYVLGLFPIIIGNKYTLFNVNASVHIKPQSYDTIYMDGVECTEFLFPAGSVVIANLTVAVDATLPFHITDIIVDSGNRVPYLTRDDYLLLMSTCPKFSGMDLPNYAYMTVYLGHTIRQAQDKSLLARHAPKTKLVTYIAFKNIQFGAPDTFSKFNGGYMEEGMNDALINQTETASTAELILRA